LHLPESSQLNNFRLAPSFVSSGASSDPSAACASGFTLCPGWRPSSGSHRLSTPSTSLAINFRLAPAVFSSSLPATNSDALTGHQLRETLRLLDLWTQVQKSSKFVDFTKVGALLRFLNVNDRICCSNVPI
jgi:hypothetical protein